MHLFSRSDGCFLVSAACLRLLDHWPQRTRLAPFVWAGVIGSIADHFNIAYTCEHYHPTYVPKFAPSRPPMTEAEFAKQEAEQREIIQRMRKEDKKQ